MSQKNCGIQIPTKCELLKVLRVVGERDVQLFQEHVDILPVPATKLERVEATITGTDTIVGPKVVKQGVVHKQIFFVDVGGFRREVTVETPFTVEVEIPGVEEVVEPEFQNHVVSLNVEAALSEPTQVSEKVVAVIRIKVSEFVQRYIKTSTSPECLIKGL